MPAIKIATSILTSDFSRLGEEVRALGKAGADWVHLDVIDGHFAPNITFGPAVVASLRQHCEAIMDVHLMIEDPDAYVKNFADAGADNISFHVEAALHPHRVIQKIKDAGCRAGIVLNPGTSQDEIAFLAEAVDFVLVMTVNPGFGGQRFIPDMIRKIQSVRAMIGEKDLQVDGGIDPDTARDVVKAGANVLVAGSYVFANKSYAEAIQRLRTAASTAISKKN